MRPAQIANFIPCAWADQNKGLVRAVLGRELVVTSHLGLFSAFPGPSGRNPATQGLRLLKARRGRLP